MSTTCGAQTRAGKPCARTAGYGTSHVGVGRCKNHGGASPQAELGGRVALARREAAVLGHALEIDPIDAILQCVYIAAGEVRYYSDRIAELRDDEVMGPVTTTVDRDAHGSDQAVSYHQVTEAPPALNVWIRARREAMVDLREHSRVAIAAGIEERRVKIAEDQGAMLAEVVRNILAALGHKLDDPEVREVVRHQFTLIRGGAQAA